MLLDAPYDKYESVFRTGSSVICNPPVTDTDEDYMFYTEDMERFAIHLLTNGWETCGKDYEGHNAGLFRALRKGKLNYLLTDSQDYYDKFEEATKVATKLNLLQKEQRIALFNYIINGELN